MNAFNKRFQPWELWGLPAAGVFGGVGALVGALMAFLLPLPLNVLFGAGGMLALVVAIVAFILGEEFPWLVQKLLHRAERSRRSRFGGL